MSKSHWLVHACLIVSATGFLSTRTTGQQNAALPAELNQNSSVADIITHLDWSFFRNARVLLKETHDAFTYRPPWDDTEPAKSTFLFNAGFRVTNIDGCNVMLRNDDAKRFDKSSFAEKAVIADLWLQLHRLSPTKGRSPYRYTKDPQKARLLGVWRTNYQYRGTFSRTIIGLTLYSPEWKEPQRWEGPSLAFIFDDKETSQQFDAAFRRAITLCKQK